MLARLFNGLLSSDAVCLSTLYTYGILLRMYCHPAMRRFGRIALHGWWDAPINLINLKRPKHMKIKGRKDLYKAHVCYVRQSLFVWARFQLKYPVYLRTSNGSNMGLVLSYEAKCLEQLLNLILTSKEQ